MRPDDIARVFSFGPFPRLREKMAGIFAHFKSVREAFVSSFAPQFFSTRFFTP